VTAAIREPEISRYASAGLRASRGPPALSRSAAPPCGGAGRSHGGRDIGTKVFPDTPHKFFLTASPRSGPGGEPPAPTAGHPSPMEEVLVGAGRRDRRSACKDSPSDT
jgi:hypothetical protein